MRNLRILVLDELAAAPRRVRTWLFVLPFATLCYWVLRALSVGAADWLGSPEGTLFAGWVLSPSVAERLFAHNPPTLAAFEVVALGTLPGFAILATYDQTSSDQDSRYLRFLALRASRGEIFGARLIAAWLVLGVALTGACVAAALVGIAGGEASPAAALGYALRVELGLLASAAAYAAFMSPISAAVSSGAFSALLGMSLYAIASATIHFVPLRWPALARVDLLLPGTLNPILLAGGSGAFGLALVAMLGYALVFAAIGWWVFRARDL